MDIKVCGMRTDAVYMFYYSLMYCYFLVYQPYGAPLLSMASDALEELAISQCHFFNHLLPTLRGHGRTPRFRICTLAGIHWSSMSRDTSSSWATGLCAIVGFVITASALSRRW